MIAIMHETAGRTLVVKVTESLTSQDYEKVFIPQLNQLIVKFGKIRVVFYLAENSTGWELGAQHGMMPYLVYNIDITSRK